MTDLPNEAYGVFALLFLTVPLMAYGVYLKRGSDRLARLIREEDERSKVDQSRSHVQRARQAPDKLVE